MEIDQFVERQNIAHYAEQLKTEPDMNKRKMLEQLLVEEKAKQASHAKVEDVSSCVSVAGGRIVERLQFSQ
jgi:hypothetical protein